MLSDSVCMVSDSVCMVTQKAAGKAYLSLNSPRLHLHCFVSFFDDCLLTSSLCVRWYNTVELSFIYTNVISFVSFFDDCLLTSCLCVRRYNTVEVSFIYTNVISFVSFFDDCLLTAFLCVRWYTYRYVIKHTWRWDKHLHCFVSVCSEHACVCLLQRELVCVCYSVSLCVFVTAWACVCLLQRELVCAYVTSCVLCTSAYSYK